MAGERRGTRFRQLRLALFLLLMLPTLTGCMSIAGAHYLPADTNVDPYGGVRAQAEDFYQAGRAREDQKDWRKALDNYRQARMWDPDNRQDIKDALNRAEAQVGTQASASAPTPAPTPKPAQPGGNSNNPAPAPTAPPAAQATRTPTPSTTTSKAGMKDFKSNAFPYTISYPSDWLAKQSSSAQDPMDTFVGQPSKGVGVVVMITAQQVDRKATLDAVYASIASSLKSQGVTDVEIADQRPVGGMPAYVLSYHVTSDSITGTSSRATARHVIFLTPGYAWSVMLMAVPGTTPDMLKTFDTMLDSMQLQSSAFPVQ